MKKFKKSEWKLMKIVSLSTTTCAQIREDEDGQRWLWVTSGKYVTAKRTE